MGHRRPDSARFTPVPHASVATHSRSIPRPSRRLIVSRCRFAATTVNHHTSTNITNTSCSRTFLVGFSLHSSTRTHRRRAVDIAAAVLLPRLSSARHCAVENRCAFCSRRFEAARSRRKAGQPSPPPDHSAPPTPPTSHPRRPTFPLGESASARLPPALNARTCT